MSQDITSGTASWRSVAELESSQNEETMPTNQQRLEGGLIGLLVGDALGVPYEFHPPGHIPAPEWIEFVPPEGFLRAHATVPPATWSDDGALALCLLAS